MKQMGPEQARVVVVTGLQHMVTGLYLLQVAEKHGYECFVKEFSPAIEVSDPRKPAPKKKPADDQKKVSIGRSGPRMPFGKFKGRLVAELPDSYLRWAASVDWIRSPLKEAIEKENQRRLKQQMKSDPVCAAFGLSEAK